MIQQVKLWDRLKTLTKSGTAGYFTQEEYNSNLYSVQYAILSLLCDNYENNQKVSDALIGHVKETGVISSRSNGYLSSTTLIDDYPSYYRTLALRYVGDDNEYPSKKISINEEAMYATSPIRKANIANNRTLYMFKQYNVQTVPKTSGNDYILVYCARPANANIAFTTGTDADNDYLVIDVANTTNIQFPEGLFNLFVYYMLESMGIEQREQIASEYSQLGINRTTLTDIK